MSKTLNNTIYYTVGAVIKAAASFVLLPIFANILGAEQYGVFNLITTFTTILGTLMTLATERSLYRLYYDYHTDEEKNRFLSSVFWMINIISTAIIIITLVYGSYVTKYFGGIDTYRVMFPAVLYTYVLALINYIQILMQVEQNCKAYLKVSVLIMAIYNVSSLCFLFLYTQTVEALVYGNLIANILVFPIAFKHIRNRIIICFDWDKIISVFKYCIPMFVMVVFSWILHATDRLFIGNLASMEDAGIYSLASKFVQLSVLLCGAIFQAYSPYFYNVTNTMRESEAKRKLIPANIVITVFVCLSNVLIALFARNILDMLFDDIYSSSLAFVYLLVISNLFMQQSGVLNLMIYQNKKTIGLSIVMMSAGAVSMACNILFIPVIGSIAAGYSNLLVGIYTFVLIWLIAKQNFYIPFGIRIVAYSVVPVILSYISDSYISIPLVNFSMKLLILIVYMLVAWNEMKRNEECIKFVRHFIKLKDK